MPSTSIRAGHFVTPAPTGITLTVVIGGKPTNFTRAAKDATTWAIAGFHGGVSLDNERGARITF